MSEDADEEGYEDDGEEYPNSDGWVQLQLWLRHLQ